MTARGASGRGQGGMLFISRIFAIAIVSAGVMSIATSVDASWLEWLGGFKKQQLNNTVESATPSPVMEIMESGQVGGVKDVSSINLFSEFVDEETGLKVITGTHFENTTAVNDSRPSRSWCYTLANEPTGEGRPLLRRINLGSQEAYGTPQYVEEYELTADHTALFNSSPGELARAARRSCRFPEN